MLRRITSRAIDKMLRIIWPGESEGVADFYIEHLVRRRSAGYALEPHHMRSARRILLVRLPIAVSGVVLDVWVDWRGDVVGNLKAVRQPKCDCHQDFDIRKVSSAYPWVRVAVLH